jgi:hypothetical protein
MFDCADGAPSVDRMARAGAALIVLVLLIVLPAASAPADTTVPRGHYMCFFYDVYGYPTLAADFWILRNNRYAGPGKKNRGTYAVGKRVAGKGRRVRFKGGAYGGWWGFYRRWKGTPTIELHNELGSVGNGCPRS